MKAVTAEQLGINKQHADKRELLLSYELSPEEYQFLTTVNSYYGLDKQLRFEKNLPPDVVTGQYIWHLLQLYKRGERFFRNKEFVPFSIHASGCLVLVKDFIDAIDTLMEKACNAAGLAETSMLKTYYKSQSQKSSKRAALLEHALYMAFISPVGFSVKEVESTDYRDEGADSQLLGKTLLDKKLRELLYRLEELSHRFLGKKKSHKSRCSHP